MHSNYRKEIHSDYRKEIHSDYRKGRNSYNRKGIALTKEKESLQEQRRNHTENRKDVTVTTESDVCEKIFRYVTLITEKDSFFFQFKLNLKCI